MARGKPIPEHIANPPKVRNSLELFYNAFWDLTTSRQTAESGPNPIPWHVIKLWCDEFGLDEEDRYAMFRHVRAMDMAYLDFHAGKMEPQGSAE